MSTSRSLIGTAAAVALSLTVGCGGGSPPPGPMGPQPLAPLGDADRLYYDNGDGITDSVRIVVRQQPELGDVWARATRHQTSPAPPPTVDFEEYMVVVAGAGRMDPQDRIRVDSVGIREVTDARGESQDVLLVVVRTIEGCRDFEFDAFPLEIVRVPRFGGPVRFVERREQDPACRSAAARTGAPRARALAPRDHEARPHHPAPRPPDTSTPAT